MDYHAGILFDEQAISLKVKELAEKISRDYADRELLLICILKGALVFTADLMRAVTVPLTVDFIQAASYGNSTRSSGSLEVRKDLDGDIRGRDVLLVDTIVDTGQTLHRLITLLSQRGPRSLRTVVLLDKPSKRTAPVAIDYRGFEIPDLFVVGYGMDYGQKYRNLPSIAILDQK